MKTRKGISPAMIAVVLLGGFLVATQTGLLSQTTTPSKSACGFLDAARQNCGDSSTLDIRTFNVGADSRTQVGSTVYSNRVAKVSGGQEVTDLGSASSGASSTAQFSEFVVGDRFEAIAFGSTYDYGFRVAGDVGSTQVSESVNVLEGVSTPLVEVYDENNDKITSAQTFGSGQTKTWEKVQVEVNASDKAYNLGMICYSTTNTSAVEQVDIKDERLTEVAEPDVISGTEQCWKYNDRVGLNGAASDVPQDFETVVLDTVEVNLADGQDPNGNTDITFDTLDYGPYIDGKASVGERFQFGVEDEDGNQVAVDNLGSKTVTLN